MMIGGAVAAKCLGACLFLELTQHPTWPQLIHSRRCTHVSPSSRHSLQPLPLGVTTSIWSRCVQTATFGLLGVCRSLLDDWCLRPPRRRPEVEQLRDSDQAAPVCPPRANDGTRSSAARSHPPSVAPPSEEPWKKAVIMRSGEPA